MLNLNSDNLMYFENDKDKLLSQLIQDYATELKRIAYLYVNDLAECEDIIQEVFISSYKNLSNYRHESSYKTWLIRITINKCKDNRKRWSVKNMIYKSEVFPVETNDSAENQYIQGLNSTEIIKQISILSTKYKEVLILYYYQEMSMSEISEVLEISINTVKSRLLRGKGMLQSKLEGGK
ncbi:sigma-70 family RNA polymerase sigma factor [Paenisporosarcina indica]|uniref:sigma-70 family RNA polymerase sigma factor n=1 Tax=Paenisporosarcina indica TaxID=650093 RepID=UPI000A065404|nr:sigma-70 family RNA polymerase sigma factor [Paenisporosarcina indica]